ncbi:MAG: OB-fold nucleic acid binding domain-containing protein [Eisenbergiella sp.]
MSGRYGNTEKQIFRHIIRRKQTSWQNQWQDSNVPTCTELSTANIGETVTVMGWVQKSRNKGGIIFVDLRDRSGILQIIFEESD